MRVAEKDAVPMESHRGALFAVPEGRCRPLFDALDLADAPGFVEEGRQRAVKPQDGEPAFARHRLDPVATRYALGLFGREPDRR